MNSPSKPISILDLPALVMELYKKRNWSLHWADRHSYMTLETAELVEAIRGKYGDKTDEAADVMMTFLALTESSGIPLQSIIDRAYEKSIAMMDIPKYKHEYTKDMKEQK